MRHTGSAVADELGFYGGFGQYLRGPRVGAGTPQCTAAQFGEIVTVNSGHQGMFLP